MVDNRAAGFYGVSGALNFKSGDISGTAAKTNEDKAGTDAEYMRVENEDSANQPDSAPFVDKSAQLNATLSSLAMLNVASVINSKLPKLSKSTKRFKELIDETEDLIVSLKEEQEKEKDNPFSKKEEDNDNDEDDEYY